MFDIGTKVYYTGDVANQDGDFEIIAHRNGYQYDLREIEGKREMLGVMSIATTYNGTCVDRFVTQEARLAYRDASIKELERAAMRRSYLTHQAALDE